MSNQTALHYSLVIPAFNEVERLRPPLERSVEWLRGRGRPFEIIISDDGSRDGTASLVERLQMKCPSSDWCDLLQIAARDMPCELA
jgi:glycosyltransferase involved in cell wall biosynthesis